MGDSNKRIPPTWEPIKDAKGRIVGYVDTTGRLVGDKDGNPIQSPIGAGMGGGAGSNTFPDPVTRAAEQVGIDPKKAAERDRQVKADRQRAADEEKQKQLAGLEYVWIDGHRVHVNDDGTLADEQGKQAGNVAFPTAFDALDGTIDPKAPFLMSVWSLGKPPSGQGMLTGIFHAAATGGRNMLTVQGGVQWLAELATKDQGAYQAMLEKLNQAGYLSDSDLATAAGHWSTAAGQALALAARDVAVVNTTEQGHNITLDQFLASKQGAHDAAKGSQFTPVERRYTDPDAIKAAARSVAEDTLGRQLNAQEEAQLATHFRSLEDAAFDAQDSAGRQGNNAAFVDPNPSGQVDAYVNGPEHAQEAADWRAAQYGEALKQLFSQTTRLT